MNNFQAQQRTTSWANAEEEPAAPLALVQGEGDLELVGPDEHLYREVRSIDAVQHANEVGAWSLEYLGPGFHIQLRIARRQRHARVDGWMSPARPIKILLSSLLRHPVLLEAHVNDSGRFEFPVAPTGACRMSFVLPAPGRPPATPPFWI